MREVKEETGLDVDVQDLITVEVQGGGWYRFSFFCTVKGLTFCPLFSGGIHFWAIFEIGGVCFRCSRDCQGIYGSSIQNLSKLAKKSSDVNPNISIYFKNITT